jgi:glutaredoxin-like protein NrdH
VIERTSVGAGAREQWKGIECTVVDLSTNPAALKYVMDELGYSAAPVVVASDQDHWSGFRPDLIDKHAA